MVDILGMIAMFFCIVFFILTIFNKKKNEKFSQKMKKLAGIFFVIMLLLAVMSTMNVETKKDDEKQETVKTEEKSQEQKVKKQEDMETKKVAEEKKLDEEEEEKQKKVDKQEKEKEKKKEEEESLDVKPMKAYVSKEEFETKFERYTEETQYENGLFQLKDGTQLRADYFTYENDEWFEYAIAIFYEGKMAKIQLETDKTQEEVEEWLGVDFERVNADVVPYLHGIEIFFDERFHDRNVAIYPNEWD